LGLQNRILVALLTLSGLLLVACTPVQAEKTTVPLITQGEQPASIPLELPKGPRVSLQPILFVPRGLSYESSEVKAIETALTTVRGWYFDQIGITGFSVDQLRVIQGQQALSGYCPGSQSGTQCIRLPGKQGFDPAEMQPIYNELGALELGFARDRILVVFIKGGYNWAWGGVVGDRSGFALLGDWALDGLNDRYLDPTFTNGCELSEFSWAYCQKNAHIGALIHEIGHAFGLFFGPTGHPAPDGRPESDPNYWYKSVMAAPHEWPYVRLLDSEIYPEKQTVLQFLSPD
jgi:hypothetical protein